jgi:hypothetical protein
MTTVNAALARWSKQSNRKRALETCVRTLPWLAAAAAVTAYAYERAGMPTSAAIGGVLAGAALVAAIRRQRSVRHAPASLARSLDAQHHTVDLLQTALALETNPRSSWDPDNIDPLVLARAQEIVPTIAPLAVPPLRLRASPFAGLTVIAACSLFLLTGAKHREDEPTGPALGDHQRAQASELEKAIDQLAQDPALSPEARAKLQAAKHALERAATARTGKAALAEMSEAQRLLDEVAPHMDEPKPSELAKLSREKLAEQLAQAAKSGDSQALAALTREAMRRAASSPAEAQALADALSKAAAKAGGHDPWGEKGFDSSPEGKRLAELAAAAEKMKSGDAEAMKAAMSALAKSGRPGSSSGARMAAARRMLSEMRAAERSELNGTEMADARAEAAREAARGMPRSGMATRPGTGMGSGKGMGKGMGMGMGMGMGSGMGAGKGMGMGMGPGSGMGSGGSSTGLNVLAGAQPPGGAAGSSGAHGGTTPSGASEPETVEAEEVETPPPAALSPEGVIRAIAEHAAGDHVSEEFGPVRDKYEAIAEAAIHRDEIPLTRRDFIQRYFEALRNTRSEDQP